MTSYHSNPPTFHSDVQDNPLGHVLPWHEYGSLPWQMVAWGRDPANQPRFEQARKAMNTNFLFLEFKSMAEMQLQPMAEWRVKQPAWATGPATRGTPFRICIRVKDVSGKGFLRVWPCA